MTVIAVPNTSRVKPWEGIQNTKVNGGDGIQLGCHALMQSADALFPVEKRASWTTDQYGNRVESDDYVQVVNPETGIIVGQATKTYEAIQSTIVADLGAEICAADPTIKPRSAGTMNGGKFVFLNLEGEGRLYGGDEKVGRNIVIFKTHDGSYPLTVMPFNTRFSCTNQFTAMGRLFKESTIKIRHTKNSPMRIEDARIYLQKTYQTFDSFDAEVHRLLDTEYSREQFIKMVHTIKPRPEDGEENKRGVTSWENQFEGIVAAYDGDDNRGIKDTKWGALMGVNTYEQWSAGTRGVPRAEAQARRMLTGVSPLTGKAHKILTSV